MVKYLLFTLPRVQVLFNDFLSFELLPKRAFEAFIVNRKCVLGIFGILFKKRPESECLTHYSFYRFVLSTIFARCNSQIEIDDIYRFLCFYRDQMHSSLKYE